MKRFKQWLGRTATTLMICALLLGNLVLVPPAEATMSQGSAMTYFYRDRLDACSFWASPEVMAPMPTERTAARYAIDGNYSAFVRWESTLDCFVKRDPDLIGVVCLLGAVLSGNDDAICHFDVYRGFHFGGM